LLKKIFFAVFFPFSEKLFFIGGKFLLAF